MRWPELWLHEKPAAKSDYNWPWRVLDQDPWGRAVRELKTLPRQKKRARVSCEARLEAGQGQARICSILNVRQRPF